MFERDRQAERFLNRWSGFSTGIYTSMNIPKQKSSLSQILEESVPEKYYLSATACKGILRRAKKRGKELPKVLEDALMRQGLEEKQGRNREA